MKPDSGARRRSLRRILAGGALLLGLAVVADALRPVVLQPPPGRLVERMRRAWEKVGAYQADLAVGEQGPRGPSQLRQWRLESGELISTGSDAFGFRHVERWRSGTWDYFQPGAGLEAEIAVEGGDRIPHARWRVSERPSLDDLVLLVSTGMDHRVVHAAVTDQGRLWILEFTAVPPEGAAPGEGEPESFGARFGRPWRVWLSERTGLPVHALIAAGPGSLRIGVERLEVGPLRLPENWRALGGTDTTVRRRLRLQCDAADEAGIRRVRERLRQEVEAWRRRLFPERWDELDAPPAR